MKNEKIMLKTIKMILFYILPTVQNIFGIGEGLRVDWADVIELQLWIDIISYEMQLFVRASWESDIRHGIQVFSCLLLIVELLLQYSMC